jgi:hypothetical protein
MNRFPTEAKVRKAIVSVLPKVGSGGALDARVRLYAGLLAGFTAGTVLKVRPTFRPITIKNGALLASTVKVSVADLATLATYGSTLKGKHRTLQSGRALVAGQLRRVMADLDLPKGAEVVVQLAPTTAKPDHLLVSTFIRE